MSKSTRMQGATIGRMGVAAAVGAFVVLGAAGCTSSNTNSGASTSTVPVDTARSAFCTDLASHIQVLDRYGQIFTSTQLTVGDLKSAASDVAQTRTALEGSANTLADAIDATNQAASESGSTTTTVLASTTADEHLAAIDMAENELNRTVEGVDSNTPVNTAAAEVQAAAFGVEQAYVSLFVDAGCLADDAQAAQTLNRYTTALQQDLSTLGFYTASVDGLYGPATVTAVKALQASAGLPQTGIVDPATEAALTEQLAAHGQQQSLNIAALQGALAAAGHYSGPIDGTWTPALEAAVKDYQTAQSLPATGAIDAATLAALLNGGRSSTSTTTTPAPTSTSSTTSTPS